jgi:hypothetical protein
VLLRVSAAEVDVSMMQWREGERRRRELEVSPRERAVVERVIEEIAAELGRRVGQTFTLRELARAYAQSEAWCRDIAQRAAARDVAAQDLSVVQDAAFARFARGATDFRSP